MKEMKNYNNIKKWRVFRNLSQQELSNRLECSIAGLRIWEKGDCMPKIQKVKKLCEILDVTEKQLFERD